MGVAFDGLRVVEIGKSDAARYCGMLFSDFGASVVQLEDANSAWQPHDEGYDFFGRMLNRGKYRPEQAEARVATRDVLERWLENADVLIDGGARGGVAALGLGRTKLRERFPKLVTVGLSLAGREGPSAHLDGCELIAAARASDLHMTGWPHRPPTRSISPKAEIYAAMWGFAAVVAALRPQAAAAGTYIDVAYADALLSAMDGSIEHFFESGRSARRKTGEGLLYQVEDGYVVLYPGVTDPLWARFCSLVNRPELVSHPLMKDSTLRRRYPELVEEVVLEWISGKTRSQVVDECRRGGVVATPVHSLDEIIVHPQTEAMNLIVEGGDANSGWKCGGYPIQLSRTPAAARPHGKTISEWPLRIDTPAPPQRREGQPPEQGPLTGTLVLDLGRGIASPYCSMVLADLGATVIRIEDPSLARKEFINFSGARRRDGKMETVLVGSYRERNKKSLLLDLSSSESRPVLDSLIRNADVLLSNLAPGALDRFGYGESRLSELNSRLVYVSNTGYGHLGPLAAARAVDPIAVAFSALMSLGGFEGDPPTKPGQAQIDYLAGLAMAVGTVTALYERDRSDSGQVVRTSLFAMALTTLGGMLEQRLAEGATPPRSGNSSYRFGDLCAVWPTKDEGHIAIDVTATAALDRFQALVSASSGGNADSDVGVDLSDFASKHEAHEAARILGESAIPAAVVTDTKGATGLSDYWVRDMFLSSEHPDFGTVLITGSPVRINGQGLRLRSLGPRPGQHSAEVLRSYAGLDQSTVDCLLREGIVQASVD